MKMTKSVLLRTAIFAAFAASVFANGTGEEAEGSPWEPSKNVEWVVTSSAGGGSSIFTQTIVEIIETEGLVGQDIIINYKTDGGGAVGRRQVSRMTNEAHTLLTFNSGDLQPFSTIEGGDLDQVTPLAVMAIDGQIILAKAGTDYRSIEDVIAAVDSGTRLIMGGSKADDEAIYTAFKAETGADREYLRSDSTGEALTQLLGGHVDIAVAKPAASFNLVASGELIPLAAATAAPFDAPFDAPTLKSLGYDIEFTIWRGIAGPGDMPAEAAAFWADVFEKVSRTDSWKNDYIAKFLLNPNHMRNGEAKAFMQVTEDAAQM